MRLTATPKADGFPLPAEITVTRSFAPWMAFSGELFPTGTPRPVAHPQVEWGSKARRPTYLNVRLLITYPDGRQVTTTFRAAPVRAYVGGGSAPQAQPSPLIALLRTAQHAAADQPAKPVR